MAVTDSADSIRLLETDTGRELASFESPNQQSITHLDFSPDSGQLAAACSSGPILLWDLRLIRDELAAMHLDWEAPHLAAKITTKRSEPLTINAVAELQMLSLVGGDGVSFTATASAQAVKVVP